MPYSVLKYKNRKNGCFEACGTPTPNLGGAYFGRSRGNFEAYAKIGWFWHLNIESRGQRGGCSIPRFDDSNGVYDGMEV